MNVDLKNNPVTVTHKLNNLRQQAAALDQQAMPIISAARLLEGYGRLVFDLAQVAAQLEAENLRLNIPHEVDDFGMT